MYDYISFKVDIDEAFWMWCHNACPIPETVYEGKIIVLSNKDTNVSWV